VETSAISDLIRKSMKENHITGASVAIVNGTDSSVNHFGYSDKANGINVGNSTLFKIGSITKVFTASAVMQLAEQGKINIDNPINEYIPEFSVKSRFESTRPITIRDILCHHSGLPCDNLSGYINDDPEAFHSAVPFLKNTYTVCPPGEIFYYSNLGYEILGVLISRISGMSYHKYIETVLLKKLEMETSAIVLSDEQKKLVSLPYRKDREQTEPVMKTVPEGGIYSTAGDMLVFMKSILGGGKGLFERSNTLDEMFVPQYPDNAIDMSFINGLGWFIGKPGLQYGGKEIWHDGGTPNFFSLLVLIPERQLGITLLTNSSSGAIMNHTVSVKILQTLLKETYKIEIPVSKEKDPAHLSLKEMEQLTGNYFTLSGIAAIAVSGKYLTAKLSSGKFRLQPQKDGWFGLIFMLFGILPLKLKQLAMIRLGIPQINGERILATEQLGFRSPQGKKYRELKISEAWKKRTGTYVCKEINPHLKSVKLLCNKDGLSMLIETNKLGKLNPFLEIVNDNEAVTVGYGRYSGETVFASDNMLNVFGLEFRK
jgi:CubicO group peptidase (beta-lactamase class C family)